MKTLAAFATLRGDSLLISPRYAAQLDAELAGAVASAGRASSTGRPRTGPARSGRAGRGSVAVLDLFGFIVQRPGIVTEFMGGTSTQEFRQRFDAALQDEFVGTIIIRIDSPGGTSAGVGELSDVIYAARGVKPIIAIVDSCACSAAYWIASSASKFYCTPGGVAGSIGVYVEHWSEAKYLEDLGLEHTFIFRGDRKVDGNPYQELSDTAREEMQASVDECYRRFVGAVARNRGVSVRKVIDTYGQGRTWSADESKQLGLVDDVLDFDAVLARAARAVAPATPASKVEKRLPRHVTHNRFAKTNQLAGMRARQAERHREIDEFNDRHFPLLLGYVSVFNTPYWCEWAMEITRAGSFAPSEDVIGVWGHAKEGQLAGMRERSLALFDDGFGLLALAKPNHGDQAWAACSAALSRPHTCGMSFEAPSIPGRPCGLLYEVRNIELSVISFGDDMGTSVPANPSTLYIAATDERATQHEWTDPDLERPLIADMHGLRSAAVTHAPSRAELQLLMKQRAEFRLLRYAAKLQGVKHLHEARAIVRDAEI